MPGSDDFELPPLSDGVLELLTKPKHEPRPATPPPRPPGNTDCGGTPYGLAALHDECARLASTPEGQRNDQLNRAAFSLAQLLAGGELTDSGLVEAELIGAALVAGLPPDEITRTLAARPPDQAPSGLQAGLAQPRTAPPRSEPSPSNGRGHDTGPPPGDDVPPWEPGPDEPDFGRLPHPEEPSGAEKGSAMPGAEGNPKLKEFQAFDAADRQQWTCQEIRWLVEPILAADNIGYDHSLPKTFKSWRALDLAFCMAHGIPWLGKYQVPNGRVVYFANEDRLRRFKVRLGEIEVGYKLGPPPRGSLLFIPIRDQADPRNRHLDLTDLIDRGAVIRSGKGADLIVFDMVAYMMGDLDEDTKIGFNRFANHLREIQDATESALYGVEHDRKGSSNPRSRGTEPDPQEMRGSGAKYGLVDLLVSAKRPGPERRVIVRIENRDHDEIILLGVEIASKDSGELKIRPFDLEAAAEMNRAEGQANKQRIKAELAKGPSAVKWLANALKMSPSTVQEHLNDLLEKGEVTRTGKAHEGYIYRLASERASDMGSPSRKPDATDNDPNDLGI